MDHVALSGASPIMDSANLYPTGAALPPAAVASFPCTGVLLWLRLFRSSFCLLHFAAVAVRSLEQRCRRRAALSPVVPAAVGSALVSREGMTERPSASFCCVLTLLGAVG